MNDMLLQQTLARIKPVDRSLVPAIQAHLDDLTKPPGSLGRLEELAMRYALAQGAARPRRGGRQIVCFAGDHGVAAEGVSAFPAEVTPQMVFNMLAGGAAINVLCRHAGIDLRIVDMGVNADLGTPAGLRDCKVRKGTDNIAAGPAMSEAEAARALAAGIRLADEAAAAGVTLAGTGEMGIANTTPSAALFAAYLGLAPEAVTGRGTGVDDQRLAHKVAVIGRALAVNRGRCATPLGTLAALGGFEIAGIAGYILGAAAARMLVVVDGFISTAGALAACRLAPATMDYLVFSHQSDEQGHAGVLCAMGVDPLLKLQLRLGEGTGAALAIQMAEAALKLYDEMATFSSAGVSGAEE